MCECRVRRERGKGRGEGERASCSVGLSSCVVASVFSGRLSPLLCCPFCPSPSHSFSFPNVASHPRFARALVLADTSIYITWICTLGCALLGNWVWWLAILIPGFAGWKLFNVAKPFLGMFLPGLFGPKAPKEEGAAAAAGGEPGESRKQAKLRARMEKGDKRVQAVRR